MPTLCCVVLFDCCPDWFKLHTSRYTEESERAIQSSCFMFPAGWNDNKAGGSYHCCWWEETKKKKLLNACFSGAMKKILEKIYCHSLKNHFNIFFPTQHHQSYKDPDMERRGVLRKCPRKSSLYCDYLFMKIFLSRCC